MTQPCRYVVFLFQLLNRNGTGASPHTGPLGGAVQWKDVLCLSLYKSTM